MPRSRPAVSSPSHPISNKKGAPFEPLDKSHTLSVETSSVGDGYSHDSIDETRASDVNYVRKTGESHGYGVQNGPDCDCSSRGCCIRADSILDGPGNRSERAGDSNDKWDDDNGRARSKHAGNRSGSHRKRDRLRSSKNGRHLCGFRLLLYLVRPRKPPMPRLR
jgi:hypothetical protein